MLLESPVDARPPLPPAIAAGPDDARDLRKAFGRFATGVTIVTTRTEEGSVGITANSFASISLDPPLVAWAVGRRSRRFRDFADCRHYAIHVLAADQHDLCWRFAREGRDFAGTGVEFGAEGTPLLPGALARFECEIANRVDGGDHQILIGRVLRTTVREGEPLVFSGGRHRRLAPET